uniref:ESPR domain-containing protein n=1 Tax=uncultured Megasphaera sp. TaxID=165188 RepID=UPI0025F7F6AE
MNRTYKVIWSKARRCYVVVSELAKGQHKSSSKSEQISSNVHQGGDLGKAALVAVIAGLLTFGGMAYSPVMAAGSGDTDTLINKMSGNYNHPDRNLVIKWTDPKLSDGAAIRNVDVNAKNITVEADFKGNQWNDKGVISEDKTHITASGDIKITSHNDSVFTEGNKGTIVIDGFKNLIIKSTGVGSFLDLYRQEGFGLVDNSSGITINGGQDSTVDITTSAVMHPGIGNHIGGGVGTGITINAGKTIKIFSNAGSIFSDKGANNDKFKVALNAPVIDLTGIVKANYGDVFLNSGTGGTVTIKDKKKGSVSAMNGAKVTINEKAQGLVQLDGKISAKSGASVMANMTGTGSYLNTDSNKNAVEVSGDKSNVTLNVQGTDSYIKGNILTKNKGQADIKMTGQHSYMIGDAVDKNGTLNLAFENQSVWHGNLDADSVTAS